MTNVVMLILDALRSRNLSIYGYDKNTSPNISSLASEGAIFLNAYALTDQTDPSFTTILTGRHPLVHGITRHGFDLSHKAVIRFQKKGIKLLPEVIKHTSAAVDWLGRWHKRGYWAYGPPSEFLEGPLFRKFKGLYPLALTSLSRTMGWGHLKRTYLLFRKLGFCWDKLGLCSVETAVNLLKNLKRPYFLLVHFWDTHTPFQGVPKFLVRKFMADPCRTDITEALKKGNQLWRDLALKYHLKGLKCVEEIIPSYDASIRFADEAIGIFIEALKELREFDDTLIIITADHGDNLLRKGSFIGHGGLYQDVLHVPLIMRGPHVEKGRFKQLVSHLDIFPTILEMTKSDAKFEGEGKSLTRIFENGEEIHSWLLAVSSTARRRYALIQDGFKYVYSPSLEDAMDKFGGIWFDSVKELYDISRDDNDMHNLADARADLSKEMEGILLKKVEYLSRKGLKLYWENKSKELATKVRNTDKR